MSGGVDSSVAAALLKEQGYDVVGVFMKLWSERADNLDMVRENVCCSLEASTAARAVAHKLGIPFYVVNFEKEFRDLVVENYIREYENGRTPNPCVICNRDIKGELLFKKMKELGGDYLATGHYARVVNDSENSKYEIRNTKKRSPIRSAALPIEDDISRDQTTYHLLQGVDKNKDQTYFLWTLTQEKLAHLLFPCGDYTKPEIRQIAAKFGLPTAQRKESQGICFIPDRNVSGFLMRYAKNLTEPGEIQDTSGKVLGMHSGLVNYTIGQRERLGLGGPNAYYVVKLDSQNNVLVVGNADELYSKNLNVGHINWINEPRKKNIGGRIRYGHPVERCVLKSVDAKQLAVDFEKPQRAVTPGQSIVFYDGEEVLGGGIIK